MLPNSQFPADLVTFTEEFYNGKIQFLRSVLTRFLANVLISYTWKHQKENLCFPNIFREYKLGAWDNWIIHNNFFHENFIVISSNCCLVITKQQCVKYQNFTWFPGVNWFIWKGTVSVMFWTTHSKLLRVWISYQEVRKNFRVLSSAILQHQPAFPWSKSTSQQ